MSVVSLPSSVGIVPITGFKVLFEFIIYMEVILVKFPMDEGNVPPEVLKLITLSKVRGLLE